MRYLGQRLIQFVLVFVVVTFGVMAATRIGSTDPARDLAGGAVSEAQIAQVEEDYPYLDEPLVVQYGYWLKDIFTGDWGRSYVASQSVVDMFEQRLPTHGVHRAVVDRARPADRRAGGRLQRLPARRAVRPASAASARSR